MIAENPERLPNEKPGDVPVVFIKRGLAGVDEPIPTFPALVTLKIEVPLDDATFKGSKVVVPWILKLIVDEVALTPETVPLSLSVPMVNPVEEAQVAT